MGRHFVVLYQDVADVLLEDPVLKYVAPKRRVNTQAQKLRTTALCRSAFSRRNAAFFLWRAYYTLLLSRSGDSIRRLWNLKLHNTLSLMRLPRLP